MSKKLIILAMVVVLVILIIILLAIRIPKPVEEISIIEPEVIEPEIVPEVFPLVSGKQTFEIITDVSKTFRIIEAELDPLDVKEGESQRVRVLVKDFEDKPITQENRVEGLVFTDNKSAPFSFELKEVTDANGATLTTWEGFWILTDTYDKIYMINIVAKATDQEHSIDLTFR